MTLPLPAPRVETFEDVQMDLDALAMQFPVSAQNIAGSVQGTTLPTNPVNGQDFYYIAASGVWHLKYRAAASGYKWDVIGGPPLQVASSTLGNVVAADGVVTLSGMSITAPLSGDYNVWGDCQMQPAQANVYADAIVYVAGVSTGHYAQAVSDASGGWPYGMTVPVFAPCPGVVAGQAIDMRAQTNGTVATGFRLRHLYAMATRVT